MLQKLKVKQKLLILLISLLCITGLTIGLIVDQSLKSIAMHDILMKIRSDNGLGLGLINAKYPGQWSVTDNHLTKGGRRLEDDYQIVDNIKHRTGSLATIFLYDTRILTNVVKEDGTRAVGTKAAPEVINRVLNEGKAYSGEANILGRKCETMYIPLRNSSGKVIGMWFTGVNKETVLNQIRQINWTLYIIMIFIIIIAIVIANMFTNSVLKSLPSLMHHFQSAAQGDLTVKASVLSQDEIGQISIAFNNMLTQQQSILEKIKSTANSFGTAANELNQGNQDLSQRTQEQAATLEEVASTIQLNASSLEQIAANSSQASDISQITLGNVKAGKTAVKETEDAMEEITNSSRKIAEIIRVVNDIAFQTNLLALNAAVEAARAGEQGRGFAVVAAEVRNLAQRVTESSKEIEKLIQESVDKIEKGNLSVRNSSKILEQIVENTNRASDIVQEITAAVKEQSFSANQIQTSIEQLNQVTQQNAAMVEEITASTVSLNDQAEELTTMVSTFHLED